MKELLLQFLSESKQKTKAEALCWLLLQDSPFVSEERLAREWGWAVEDVQAFLNQLSFDEMRKKSGKIPLLGNPNRFETQTDERNLPREVVKQRLDKQMASKEERRMLYELEQIENYPVQYVKDLQYLRKLMVEYPDVNMLEEVKKFAAHKLDKPFKKRSNPRLALRNWIRMASERREKHANDGRDFEKSGSRPKASGKFERLRKTRMGM